jgi:copper resistance protein C
MRNFIAAIAFALLPLGTAGAQAHAFLDHAEPRVGSTVASAPREVSLSFTQDLEAAFSSVQVSDAKGTRVDQGKPQVSASVMRIGLKPLPPGTYKVRWRALSVDTHTTEGTFSFRIGP